MHTKTQLGSRRDQQDLNETAIPTYSYAGVGRMWTKSVMLQSFVDFDFWTSKYVDYNCLPEKCWRDKDLKGFCLLLRGNPKNPSRVDKGFGPSADIKRVNRGYRASVDMERVNKMYGTFKLT